MSKNILYPSVYLLGVIISSVAQILLKKSSGYHKHNLIEFIKNHAHGLYYAVSNKNNKLVNMLKQNKALFYDYFNAATIIAYSIFFVATFMTIFAYKGIPLSAAPILGSTEYIFIAILSRIFLKENINMGKIIGLLTIIIGILVYSY